jgi:SAM-dependent methyltransferase
MIYSTARRLLPLPLLRYVYHFEASIESAVESFSGSLPGGCRVLDAGAGETQYKPLFRRHRYTAVDLAVGDSGWNYSSIDVLADLTRLPFPDATFDAALNIVTLEHLRDPAAALAELARVLRGGARLLLVAPLEWEVHQAPHDYFRYTRHGLELLLSMAGFTSLEITPVGGFWRLLARRLLNGVQQSPLLLKPLAALLFIPLALLTAALDPLDPRRDFTLGYRCLARKA